MFLHRYTGRLSECYEQSPEIYLWCNDAQKIPCDTPLKITADVFNKIATVTSLDPDEWYAENISGTVYDAKVEKYCYKSDDFKLAVYVNQFRWLTDFFYVDKGDCGWFVYSAETDKIYWIYAYMGSNILTTDANSHYFFDKDPNEILLPIMRKIYQGGENNENSDVCR